MGNSKESGNDPTVTRKTVTDHAKRQRLTRVDLSQGPNAPIPNEEQVESLVK